MISLDQALITTAQVWAMRSRAVRRQVGCVIARDGRVISTGYNGTLPGVDNRCESPDNGKTLPTVVHAEANAILFAARHGLSTRGCEAFVTLSPCVECAKMLCASGIIRVVYLEAHHKTAGLDLLELAGIPTVQIAPTP